MGLIPSECTELNLTPYYQPYLLWLLWSVFDNRNLSRFLNSICPECLSTEAHSKRSFTVHLCADTIFDALSHNPHLTSLTISKQLT